MARIPIIGEHPGNGPAPDEERPHACYDGWVFIGFEGEDSEHVEVIERVTCRRCHPESF